MARNTWDIYYWDGTNSVWVADTPLYIPNANTELDLMSTQQKISIADGSNAFMNPEIAYLPQDIVFEFLEIDPTDSFYTKMISYVKNQTYLKIVTHLDETFIGKFLSLKRVWISGVEDTFDFQCVFQRMDAGGTALGGVAPSNNVTSLIDTFIYGESIIKGAVLYATSVANTVKKASADSVVTAPVIALALETASSGLRTVLLKGVYTNSTRWTTLTPGGLIYLSETSGEITQVQPTATDHVIQALGVARSSNTIYFNPSSDYLTHI